MLNATFLLELCRRFYVTFMQNNELVFKYVFLYVKHEIVRIETTMIMKRSFYTELVQDNITYFTLYICFGDTQGTFSSKRAKCYKEIQY